MRACDTQCLSLPLTLQSCLNDVHILVTMNWRTVNTKGGRPTPRVSCTLNTVAQQASASSSSSSRHQPSPPTSKLVCSRL